MDQRVISSEEICWLAIKSLGFGHIVSYDVFQLLFKRKIAAFIKVRAVNAPARRTK